MSIRKVNGVQLPWVPFLYYELSKESQNDVICMLQNNRELSYVQQILQKINPNLQTLILPEYESTPEDKLPFDFFIATTRARCLASLLLTKETKIIFTTKKSLAYAVPPLTYFQENIEIFIDKFISITEFQQELIRFGYKKLSLVEERGQFAVRGDLIDVFPVNAKSPCRINLSGGKVNSIKLFDGKTQRSTTKLEKIVISKAKELEITEDSISIFKEKCKSYDLRNLESLEEYGVFNGIEWHLQYFFEENLVSFYEYCRKNSLLVCPQHSELTISDSYDVMYTQQFNSEQRNFAIKNEFNENIKTDKGFQLFLGDLTRYNKVIISVNSKGSLYVLESVFRDKKFANYEVIDSIDSAKGNISVAQSLLSEGFIDIENNIAYYTEKQLFGYVLKNTEKKSIVRKQLFKDYSNLLPGSYVVHQKHGIALFEGLQTIEVAGIKHDFLCLIYKNNDKLFVPVENIDLVSRYGSEDGQVEIDRLGSNSWEGRKEKVQKQLLVIADGLLKVAAKRKMRKIEPININYEQYESFCRGFPYVETDDQNAAINDVLADLKGTIPMDRLVCGDVGFGKTEVAIRAAFLVANNGGQVVLLAPTTILVNQHYKNFSKRFGETGIKICQLSRFVSKKEVKNNLEQIAKGQVRIIIATHAILSSKVKFENLAMLIVDEEQHFGVKQKEFIKSLQTNIHILTMTATPIPRTLQMAISGIRDLSIMASPPLDRLPVKTYVIDFDMGIIKKAVDREFERGGQVFVVSPRVEFLDDLYNEFSRVFSKATIKAVHGKMSNMEEIISDFYGQRINIIISTNIIDSGIDIQNANTILIYRADIFGLSQLHQLRGRVGRLSNVQGYCYLVVPTKKKLSKEAEQRINVIQNLNTLGSGFTLASHDLDIRGAGNIVGEEQSGQIRDVGIELYQKMLEGAILMKESENDLSPQINIGVPVLIPEYYIEDKNLRMTMYRRIGDITIASELDSIEIEMSDRFGGIPLELKNLLLVIKIKLLCLDANIDKVDVGKNGMIISFYNDKCKCVSKLLDFVSRNQKYVKIRSDQKLIIQKKWKTVEERTKDVEKIVKFLSQE